MSKHQVIRKDFYKILQVSRTATTAEIKVAYRKLALVLHPDRHDGCTDKTKAFKEASEAYNVLINNDRRREYDMASGFGGIPNGWYNKNRRRPPPSNYRKVYAPHAPPDGKWHDAQRHYDMHYGEGQFQEAIKQSYQRAKRNGEFDYHSPLGKGFTFDNDDRIKYNSASSQKRNPYSKAPQGPPTQQYMYEEQKGSLQEANTILKRKQGVKNKLHERRAERYEREKEKSESLTNVPGGKVYEPLNQQSKSEGGGGGCVIM